MKKAFSPEVVAKAKELRQQQWYIFRTIPHSPTTRLTNGHKNLDLVHEREWECVQALGLEGSFGREVLDALKVLCEDEHSLEPETIELRARDCGVNDDWSVALTVSGREKLDIREALAQIASAQANLLRIVQRNICPSGNDRQS